MDTTTSVVGTAVVVAAGLWTKDQHIDMRYVVGTGVYALSIAALGNANTKLAEQLALLVFVTAVLVYGVDIAKGLGLIGKGNGRGIGKIERT